MTLGQDPASHVSRVMVLPQGPFLSVHRGCPTSQAPGDLGVKCLHQGSTIKEIPSLSLCARLQVLSCCSHGWEGVAKSLCITAPAGPAPPDPYTGQIP